MTDGFRIVNKAIALAAQAHAGQVDKAGANYILHPLRVMMSFSHSDPALQAVAVLHDVVEDTDVTLDVLRAYGFSDEIVAAVDAVTRRETESYDDFIRRAAANEIGRIIKGADVVDNLQRLTPELSELEPRYKRALDILAETARAG